MDGFWGNLIAGLIIAGLTAAGFFNFFRPRKNRRPTQLNQSSPTEAIFQNQPDSQGLASEIRPATLTLTLSKKQHSQLVAFQENPDLTQEELLLENIEKLSYTSPEGKTNEETNIHLRVRKHRPPSRYFELEIDEKYKAPFTIKLDFDLANPHDQMYTVSNSKQYCPLQVTIQSRGQGGTMINFMIKSGRFDLQSILESYEALDRVHLGKIFVLTDIRDRKSQMRLTPSTSDKSAELAKSLEEIQRAFQITEQLSETLFRKISSFPSKLSAMELHILQLLKKHLIDKDYSSPIDGFKCILNVTNKTLLNDLTKRKTVPEFKLVNSNYEKLYSLFGKTIKITGIEICFSALKLKHRHWLRFKLLMFRSLQSLPVELVATKANVTTLRHDDIRLI